MGHESKFEFERRYRNRYLTYNESHAEEPLNP